MQNSKLIHIWSVLCTSSVTDKETNMMSLQNLVDQITIESFPQVKKENKETNKKAQNKKNITAVPINLEIVSFLERLDDWQKDDMVIEEGLELIDPKGNKIKSGALKINIQKGMRRIRHRTRMNGISVTTPGEYWIKIKFGPEGNSKEVAALPVDVKFSLKIN